jgi:hypothetical protein
MKDEKDRRLQEVPDTIDPPQASDEDCAFCSLLCQSTPAKGVPDGPTPHFLTEREMKVLAAMRHLKEEASGLKERLRQLDEKEDKTGLLIRLADLRAEWKRMDQERMDAAEERMRLLGHVQ